MKARLLLRERLQLRDDVFVELRVWQVPQPLAGSAHSYKYALAYVVTKSCVLRYDNEAGKGDHRHISGLETPYDFTTPDNLLADFWQDVDRWRPE
jgi:hypothetical protein